MRVALNAMRSKCGASDVPASESAIRCRSVAVAIRGWCESSYLSKIVFMLRDIYVFGLSLAHPRLLRKPLMLRSAIAAISVREKHRRCAKGLAIGDNSSRNDVARLRTFDHYGTLGCAHVLYPPVIPIGSWACLVVKACDYRLTAMWCF